MSGAPGRPAEIGTRLGVDVVVVAAGSSARMGGIDKMSEPVGGRPLLAWTLGALARSPLVDRIALVTATGRVSEWRDGPWRPASVRAVVAGGDRRQESVAAGFRALDALGADDDRVLLVHDGARPNVSPLLVERVARAADAHGAAIPVVPVTDTLKRIDDEQVTETVDRTQLGAAQTPQGVTFGLLRRAYARFPPDGGETFTDEAALLEACSIPVHAVPGQPDNLKVTHPADLLELRSSLAGRGPRVGFGHDGHPFGPHQPLTLGGIEIAGAPRLHGHSDGDVALHAVVEALLGAAGMGDLGGLFPADARTPRGVASSRLLADVVSRLADAGLQPGFVDLTILASRPRLAGRLEAMRSRIAELLGVAPDQVNVKASTGNLDGMEGAGRGVSARAVASVIEIR